MKITGDFLKFVADVEENQSLGTLSNLEVLMIHALRKDFKYALMILALEQTKNENNLEDL